VSLAELETGRSADAPPADRLRILAVAEVWEGSNAYAFVRAFRRMGHTVAVVPSENFVPTAWRRKSLRALRRLLEPVFVREFGEALVAEARHLRPDLFFVFKGRYVTPEAIGAVKALGAVAINFYPDVSFLAHGKHIPRALPAYDWVFTTKTFGLADMEQRLGVRSASFLPHGFDPELHHPIELGAEDLETYACDVSFVGTWSPKKQRMLEHLCASLPSLRVRVWGSQWGPARASLGARVEGRHAVGREYVKALVGSKINLAILSEARAGASSGDRITSRTFHIPATGAFMLHERNDEFLEYFREGVECACFGDPDELVAQVERYLSDDAGRRAVAEAGRRRAVESGYAVDDRARSVLDRFEALRRAAGGAGQ
jgi:spore maturation protein CgeB